MYDKRVKLSRNASFLIAALQMTLFLQSPTCAVAERIARDHAGKGTLVGRLPGTALMGVPPDDPRKKIEIGDSPRRPSTETATVTIVEFGDYQDPYGRKVQPTLLRLREEYGDKIIFVFKDFPLAYHPDAEYAAEAASCAGEQGRYWEFHDALYSSPDLSPEAIDGLAKALHLDGARLQRCAAENKFARHIQADVKQAIEMGATGTPTFNINGIVVAGLHSLEDFERIINRELAAHEMDGKVK
jgi:protein-disulfide isomerase